MAAAVNNELIAKYRRHSLLILPVMLHSLYISMRHKSLKYMIHVPMAFYTASWIVLYMSLKLCGFQPLKKSYDGKKQLPS